MNKQPFKTSQTTTENVLELVHSDVGYIRQTSLDGAHYYATYLDDHSRYSVVKVLNTKVMWFESFVDFKGHAE